MESTHQELKKTKAASASLFCLLVSCKDYSKERLMINGLFPRLLAFTVWLQWHNYKRQGVCTNDSEFTTTSIFSGVVATHFGMTLA